MDNTLQYPKMSVRGKAAEVKISNWKRRILRNKKIVNDYKREHPCSCGEKRIVCLDFHHDNEKEKKESINRLVKYHASIKRLIDEMRKCTVICANCHRVLHDSNTTEKE